MQWFSLLTNRLRVAPIVISGLLSFFSQSAYAADTQAPTVPGSLTNTAATSTTVTLGWTASTDNVGVTAYLVERCMGVGCNTFSQIASTASLTYRNTGLTVLASYRYRIRARDAANNKSAYTNVITVVTPDTTAPTTPSGMAVTIVSSSQLNLNWTVSTDNVGVTTYRIERCTGVSCGNHVQIGTSTTNSYNNTSLAANTTYRYRVRAIDAANNLSGYSAIKTAVTQSPVVDCD